MKKGLSSLLMFFLSLFLLASTFNASAIETLTLQGLSASKAVMMIDGKLRVIATGKTSPEGVKVIAVDGNGAVLEVAGEQQRYILNNSVSFNFKKIENRTEKIFKDRGGMYRTVGSINGYPVKFLVDTGATSVAMNTTQAKRLGIRYREIGTPSGVSTASGYEKAYQVKLKTVSVGGITQRNVQAMVIDGKHPGPILLGMTFLGKLKVEHNGNAMTLKQRK